MDRSEITELEVHRKLIYLLAEAQLNQTLRSKMDAEDIVQETMQSAHSKFDQLREPNNPAVVKKWLKQILCNVLTDQFRRFRSEKRDVNLEVSIGESLEHSSAGVEGWIASGHTSPSMRTLRNLLKQGLAPEQQQMDFIAEHPIIRPLSDYSLSSLESFRRER